MAWTEDRVEELKKLWADGQSASQIAAKLGGVTRNAVIGKVRRLGLFERVAPAKPKTVTTEPRISAASAPPRQPLRTVLRDLPPITDFGHNTLTVNTIGDGQCRWPIGDPALDDFHFCGRPCAEGKPYCDYHDQLAHKTVAGVGRRHGSDPVETEKAA